MARRYPFDNDEWRLSMSTIEHRRRAPALRIGMALAVLCLAWTLFAASSAHASESKYCYGQSLGGHAKCVGALRNLNALYGQGTQRVCIWASQTADGNSVIGGVTCSGAAGEGTYNAKMFEASWYPTIENNATGSGTVYGIAFKP